MVCTVLALGLMLLTSSAARADPGTLDGPDAAASDASATPLDPEVLAQRWFDQLLGFDALEAWESRTTPGDGDVERTGDLVVARKWHEEGVRIVFDVVRPRAAARVAALLIQRPGERDEMFVFAPAPPRVGSSPYSATSPRRDVGTQRWPGPRLEIATPSGGSVPTAEIRPFLPGELRHELRPDEVIDGEPCRVIGSHVLAPWLNSGRQSFTHLDLALSTRTGVALRTRYYRNGRELRRVTTDPDDVELYGDRWLPTRRTVHNLENRDRTELILRNVLIDAALPDRLFTREALKRQNFPTF